MATVPVQRTWAAGEIVTAAMLNDDVRDMGNFVITSRPRAELRQTVSQNMTNGNFTLVTFTTEDLDNDSAHDTSTNTGRYTAQTAGRLLLLGGVSWASSTDTGSRIGRWIKNGAALNYGNSQIFHVTGISRLAVCPIMVPVSVGDWVGLEGRQASGATLATEVAAGEQSFMHVYWLGT